MLNEQIKDRLINISGQFGVYYKDIHSGYSCFEGNADVFIAAGIAKLFLLIEVLRQIDQGEIQRDAVHILRNEEKVPSIGAITSLHEGIELTIEDLYRVMTTVGDNTAFNILAGRVGIGQINQTLSSLGYLHSRVNRLLFDQEGISKGIENYASVHELGDMFERMLNGQLISSKVSNEIIELLKLQQRDYIIPYHFSDLIGIAHQIGEDEGIRHDAGIVFSKHPFILCMSTNQVDVRKAESAMRDIALLCLNYSIRVN